MPFSGRIESQFFVIQSLNYSQCDIQAKEEKNDALYQGTKLLMNSSYGKLGQGIHDNKIVISDDNSEIDKLYQNGQVSTDITLANEEQCYVGHQQEKAYPSERPCPSQMPLFSPTAR